METLYRSPSNRLSPSLNRRSKRLSPSLIGCPHPSVRAVHHFALEFGLETTPVNQARPHFSLNTDSTATFTEAARSRRAEPKAAPQQLPENMERPLLLRPASHRPITSPTTQAQHTAPLLALPCLQPSGRTRDVPHLRHSPDI